jgi:hypothetical protein
MVTPMGLAEAVVSCTNTEVMTTDCAAATSNIAPAALTLSPPPGMTCSSIGHGPSPGGGGAGGSGGSDPADGVALSA